MPKKFFIFFFFILFLVIPNPKSFFAFNYACVGYSCHLEVSGECPSYFQSGSYCCYNLDCSCPLSGDCGYRSKEWLGSVKCPSSSCEDGKLVTYEKACTSSGWQCVKQVKECGNNGCCRGYCSNGECKYTPDNSLCPSAQVCNSYCFCEKSGSPPSPPPSPPSPATCPSEPTSYPSDSWDRVWCDKNFGNKLADSPDQPGEMFDDNWGSGSVGGIRGDDIGFRSGRTIYLAAGNYTFYLGSDDGSRLWIDGSLCIDNWGDHPYQEKSCNKSFNSSGNHQFRIDYYENRGDARVKFYYLSLNQPPTISNPYETQNPCAWGSSPQVAPGLAITLHWTYSDPEGDPRSAFEIWLDDSPSFSDPKFNKVFNISSSESSQSYVLNLSDDQEGDWLKRLSWSRIYYWKVRVKDSKGNWSNWSNVDSFLTPNHASPFVDFSWNPKVPAVGQPVKFSDLSECYDFSDNVVSCKCFCGNGKCETKECNETVWTCSQDCGGARPQPFPPPPSSLFELFEYFFSKISFAANSTWFWTFQDGDPQNSQDQNPTIKFKSTGSKKVTLEVIDSLGSSCSTSTEVQVSFPLPFWKEIPPFYYLEKFLASLISKIRLF